MAKAKDKAGLKLVTAEAQDARKRFDELFDRTNHKGAKPADVAALKALLRENPGEELWKRIQGPMAAAESFAVEHSSGMTPGVNACWRDRLANLRKDLSVENPSHIESMLAQHAALCWLRLAEAELQHTSHLAVSHTLTSGIYYEKRLTMAQRRFTRAVETLERVRMMRRRAGLTSHAEPERRRA